MLQLKHELGAVPVFKYFPAMHVLQSLTPTPTQLTHGDTQLLQVP